MNQYPPMTVYSASAGAGKTFTLAVRYIELLIDNPFAYKDTLAVTFTNKATEEMKLRITSQLYGIARGLNESNGYLQRIAADCGLDVPTIRSRAELALKLILHDYSHFAVETIDAFFQRVLRNLARELDLSPNLRVELNDVEVEEMAVDELVAELRRGSEVLDWIMQYVSEQMEEERSWKVVENIKSFGRKIFSQQYKEHAELLSRTVGDAERFEAFRQRMRQLANPAEGEELMRRRATEFFNLIEAHGYTPNSFAGKSKGASTYFVKLGAGQFLDRGSTRIINKTIQAALDGAEGWTREARGTALYEFAASTLVPFINQVEQERSALQRQVMTARQVLRHLNDLRLLGDIERKVRAMNQDEGRFLLSDTQGFLEELMREDDAPFVYEKIGGRLLNIMIDEFQDTSRVQWRNFKKLLLNTMADEKSRNLIVGDVKQSIYRWRDGDWNLLQNIGADAAIARRGLEHVALTDNWRSEERIIRFNNQFFEKAATVFSAVLEDDGNPEAAVIRQIYAGEQSVPQAKRLKPGYEPRGLVSIDLLPTTERNKLDEHLVRTENIIRKLLQNGAEEEDIAILVRDNKLINRIADHLQKAMPHCRFVSNEAFRLETSAAVQIIITAMRSLVDGRDNLLLAKLAKLYNERVLGQALPLSQCSLEAMTELQGQGAEQGGSPSREQKDEALRRAIERRLPQDFVLRRDQIIHTPLIDIAEEISSIFQLHRLENEAAYVYAFADLLASYAQRNIPDMALFLEQWDASLHTKTIKSGSLKGISLITIHKSKGLEFKHVIMPYCCWSLVHGSGETLWCTTDVAPFSLLPVVPVKSAKLKDTVYSADYHHERLQNFIDNLNLLYVAFTRAAENLFIIGQNSLGSRGSISTATVSGFIQLTLPLMAQSTDGASLIGGRDGGEMSYRYGSLTVGQRVAQSSENIFLQAPEELSVLMRPGGEQPEFRQSNESRAFVAETDERGGLYIEAGTVMHEVLSRITTVADVERVLREFEHEGIVLASNADSKLSAHSIARFLNKRLTENPLPEVEQWFAAGARVMNECTIVFPSARQGVARERRPDRVLIADDSTTVIDFKFGNPKPEHGLQVEQYCDLLRRMGYRNVSGRLWYVYQNEIQTIR